MKAADVFNGILLIDLKNSRGFVFFFTFDISGKVVLNGNELQASRMC